MQRIVFKGLLVENKEHERQLSDGFKEMGFKPPVVVHCFKTLAGQGGEGGRSDVILEVADEDVPKLAVHPMHLSGDFSWDDDYFSNNREIIPSEALKYFNEEKTEANNAKKEETTKPACKLIGEDGNVFSIIGRVKAALKRAGLEDKAKEFSKRAMNAGSYNEVLNMTHEYVEVE